MDFIQNRRIILFLSLYSLFPAVYCATSDDMIIRRQQERIIQQEKHQQRLQQQNLPQRDVKPIFMQNEQSHTDTGLVLNESPCFVIDDIVLVDENGDTNHNITKFDFALKSAKAQSKFIKGMCLGEKSISRIVDLTQNNIISKGFTTTQVGLMPQDLSSGRLQITVIAGMVGEIKYSHRHLLDFNNEIPLKSGDIFNLRKLETGLENLQRIPTVDVDMQIAPSDIANASDIIINYRKKFPLRASFNFDDSGSESTGKYQASSSISWDNPLGLSDLFYASYNRGLGKKDKFIDYNNQATKSSSANWGVHYSFPIYSWNIGVNHSFYRYHQAVAGFAENYDYNGESSNTDFSLSKNLYRDGRRKTDASIKLWQRKSKNFVDDAEIEVQRKSTAGLGFEIRHREYISNAIINLGLSYKRGLGILGSKRPPEEAFGEGTSRMKIINADISAYIPFNIKNQAFAFDTSLHSQINKTPLLTNDKISIGGRNTVRGFDGETTLTAEKGFYWQNNLSYSYLPKHQIYIGYDYGYVSGESKKYLLGDELSGAVIGLKGNIKIGGQLYYDLFAGKPISKPNNYPTRKTALGFNLNYNF